GVVAETADDVVVMYAGRIAEYASVYDLFDRPTHPYTRGLFESLPSVAGEREGRLRVIEGTVPSAEEFPTGCRFRTRCPYATARCAQETPELRNISSSHRVACHYAESISNGSKE